MMERIAFYLLDWGPRLFEAALLTLLLTAAGFCGAFLLGLGLEALRTSRNARLQGLVNGYVWVLRAIPLLIVLYVIYFVLPGFGMTLPPMVAGALGLVLVHGAFLAEVLRAGIKAVEQGQWEAGRSLGLSRLLSLRLIVIPQAVRHMFGPLIVALISVLKDSSVCALIGVNELTLTSRVIMSESFLPLHVFLLAGLFYLALAWPLSLLARALERRSKSQRWPRPRGMRKPAPPACLAPSVR